MHIVIFTGAGISEESGLQTFRGGGGLWHNHSIEEVATIEALQLHPERVIEFYNMRRQELRSVEPNAAHHALARLEDRFQVTILTQNVDNLHERAGSTDVLHLHGELMKASSLKDSTYSVDLGDRDIEIGDTCPQGGQLRPNIVLFGEELPAFEKAYEIAADADLFLVVGTSLQVYPAAGLVNAPPPNCVKVIIDPSAEDLAPGTKVRRIAKTACAGVPPLVDQLLEERI